MHLLHGFIGPVFETGHINIPKTLHLKYFDLVFSLYPLSRYWQHEKPPFCQQSGVSGMPHLTVIFISFLLVM